MCSPMKRGARLTAVSLGLAVALGGGGLYFLYATGFFQAAASIDGMRGYIQGFAPYSHLIFFVLQLLSVIVAPIPSNISAAAGGVLFGTWVSFALTISAVLLGSAIVFLLARSLGKPFADRFVGEKVSEKYLELIRTKRDVFLSLVFLFPFFPDDLICILAGLTDIGFGRFFIIAALTRPWGLLVASAVGGAALHIPLWGMALLGLGGAALFWVGMKYGDRAEAWLLKRFGR